MVTSAGVTGRLEPKEKAAKIRIAAMNEANVIYKVEAYSPDLMLCVFARIIAIAKNVCDVVSIFNRYAFGVG